MRILSKIAVVTIVASGTVLAATALAHGPGYGYGQGVGMMGAHGGGPGVGVHGMYGGVHGPGMHGMYGAGPGAGPCLGAGTIDARLDAIESELKLTAEQAQAWEAFENAVRNQLQTMTQTHTRWSQNPDEHIAFMEQRLAGMKAVQKARTDLYNVLTPEQQAVADRYWLRGPSA